MSLLELSDFTVTLESPASSLELVSDLALTIERGEALCVVGESGSGKTVTALSVMRLLEYTTSTTGSGTVNFGGMNLLEMSQAGLASIRGKRMSMIFQECMEALNPTSRVGEQLIEGARQHGTPAVEAALKAVELLRQTGIPDPEGCMTKYPHQLSGGMQQRAMIAMALMCDPELLIADEPTTALDVTTQAEILSMLVRLQKQRDMACLLITHDMGVAAEFADRIAVMYAGRVVEIGSSYDVLNHPRHPYSKALVECVPRANRGSKEPLRTIAGSVPHPSEAIAGCRFAARCMNVTQKCRELEPSLEPALGSCDDGHVMACWNPVGLDEILVAEPASDAQVPIADVPHSSQPQAAVPCIEFTGVSKTYASSARNENVGAAGAKANRVVAVDKVNLTINENEFFGLVGESGSGKSTMGRLIADIEPVTEGRLALFGDDVTHLKGRRNKRTFRQAVQIVFQDPSGSLDPRHTIGHAIAEPLRALLGLRGDRAKAEVKRLLTTVSLSEGYAARRQSEISGGQRQRVAIARALAPGPKVIVADEPTSALDVSVQGQIVNLLRKLQLELGLTYLFITHNLTLVLAVADRVGVMYLGALVEVATPEELLDGPAHPYTRMLLEANPNPFAPRRRDDESAQTPVAVDAETAMVDRTVGCRFRDRCPQRQALCDVESPPLNPLLGSRQVACHFPLID